MILCAFSVEYMNMKTLFILLGTVEHIILVAIAILLVAYGIIVYYAISSCFKFNRKLNGSTKTIKMAVAEKILLTKTLSEKSGIELSVEEKEKLDDLADEVSSDNIIGKYAEVDKIYSKLRNLCRTSTFSDDIRKKLDINYSLNEENSYLYHSTIDEYNSDLLGYNYWCKLLITRPFTLMFRFKKKETIY